METINPTLARGADPNVGTDPVTSRRRRPRRRNVRLTRRDRLILWLTTVPVIGILLFAQAYPLLYSLYISFEHWSLASSLTPQGFAGLANYRKVFADPMFLHGLKLSALFVCTVPIELVIGFSVAYFTRGERRYLRLIRTVLLVPMIMAPIAVGTMFRLLLNPQSGFVVLTLKDIGLPTVNWLGSSTPATISALGTDIWEWVPFSIIIYSAALTSIDPNLIEAAHLDGASSRQVLRHIIVPLMLPSTAVICVFRIIDTFLVIDAVLTLTDGGPGGSTQTVALWIFDQGLRYFNLSEAAAGSWVIVVLCLLMAFGVLRLRSRASRYLRA